MVCTLKHTWKVAFYTHNPSHRVDIYDTLAPWDTRMRIETLRYNTGARPPWAKLKWSNELKIALDSIYFRKKNTQDTQATTATQQHRHIQAHANTQQTATGPSSVLSGGSSSALSGGGLSCHQPPCLMPLLITNDVILRDFLCCCFVFAAVSHESHIFDSCTLGFNS